MVSRRWIVELKSYRLFACSILSINVGSCIAPNPNFIDPDLHDTESATDTTSSTTTETTEADSDTSGFQREYPLFIAQLNTYDLHKISQSLKLYHQPQLFTLSLQCPEAKIDSSIHSAHFRARLEFDHRSLVDTGWRADGSDLSIVYYESDSASTIQLPLHLDPNSQWNTQRTELVFPMVLSDALNCSNLNAYALLYSP